MPCELGRDGEAATPQSLKVLAAFELRCPWIGGVWHPQATEVCDWRPQSKPAMTRPLDRSTPPNKDVQSERVLMSNQIGLWDPSVVHETLCPVLAASSKLTNVPTEPTRGPRPFYG